MTRLTRLTRRTRISLLGALAALPLALAGCGSASSPTTHPSGTPSATAPGVVTVTDADNGRTLSLQVGERLRVTLDSPFWTFQPVTASAVLRTDATALVSPTSTCPPPMGSAACGGQSASYTATGPGRTFVLATRVVCGEAARCTGPAGRFEITLTVTR
jgi:uncharacterized protein YceK